MTKANKQIPIYRIEQKNPDRSLKSVGVNLCFLQCNYCNGPSGTPVPTKKNQTSLQELAFTQVLLYYRSYTAVGARYVNGGNGMFLSTQNAMTTAAITMPTQRFFIVGRGNMSLPKTKDIYTLATNAQRKGSVMNSSGWYLNAA